MTSFRYKTTWYGYSSILKKQKTKKQTKKIFTFPKGSILNDTGYNAEGVKPLTLQVTESWFSVILMETLSL